MTHTNKAEHRKWTGAGKDTVNEQRRQSDISRSTTKLLRHQAQNEGVPISPQGWVKIDDLLAWKGFRDKRRFTPPVVLDDIFNAVEHDGKFGKGRFALRLVDGGRTNTEGDKIGVDGAGTENLAEAIESLDMNDTSPTGANLLPQAQGEEASSKNNPETLQLLDQYRASPANASCYMIRATQGHSIETIESEGLHKLITLDEPSTLPDTVVHGTFYGAWELILASGGLKPMGRNMVHFATGPSLAEVSPKSPDKDEILEKNEAVDDILNINKVISGMRRDAQILIYIDLKRCLEDVKAKGLDMEWFRSDNGVILTPGASLPEQISATEVDGGGAKRIQKRNEAATKIVSTDYWDTVVEIKQGLGVLWRHGDGVVKDLPPNLKAKPLPRGKQGNNKGQQKGGKPKLKVERNVVGAEDAS